MDLAHLQVLVTGSSSSATTMLRDLGLQLAGAESKVVSLGSKFTAFASLAESAVAAVTPLAGATLALGASLGAAGAGLGVFGAVALPQVLAVTTASAALAKGQKDLAAAQAAGDPTKIARAQREIAAATALLTPAQLAATQSVAGLRKAFKDLSDANAPVVLGLVSSVSNTLAGVLPKLQSAMTALGSSVKDVTGNAMGGLQRSMPAITTFLRDQAAPAIRNVGALVGNLAVTGGHLVQAFAPVGNVMTAALGKASGALRGLDFSKFASFTQGLLPQIGALGSGLAHAVGALVKAAEPLAGPVLGALTAITHALSGLFASSAFTSFVSNLEQILPALVPLLATVAGAFVQVASALTGALVAVLPQLLPIIQSLASTFVVLFQAVLPLLGPVVTLAGVLAQVVAAVAPLVTALGVALVPVVAGLTAALTASMPAVNGIIRAFVSVLPAVQQVIAALLPLVPLLLGALVPVLQLFATNVTQLAPLFGQLVTVIASLVPAAVQLLGAFLPLVPVLWGALVPVVRLFADLIRQAAPLIAGLAPVLATVVAVVSQLFKALSPVVSQLFAALVPVVAQATQVLAEMAPTLVALAPMAVNLAMAVLQVTQALLPVVTALLPLLPPLLDVLVGLLPILVLGVQSFGAGIQVIAPLLALFAAGITQIVTSVSDVVVGVTGPLQGISDQFGLLSANIGAGVTSAIGWVETLPGRITGLFADAGSWLLDAGVNIVQGLINGIESMAGTLVGAVTHSITGLIPGPVRDALGIHSPSRVMAEIGGHVMSGLVLGVTGQQGGLTRAMRDVADVLALRGDGAASALPTGVLGTVLSACIALLTVLGATYKIRSEGRKSNTDGLELRNAGAFDRLERASSRIERENERLDRELVEAITRIAVLETQLRAAGITPISPPPGPSPTGGTT